MKVQEENTRCLEGFSTFSTKKNLCLDFTLHLSKVYLSVMHCEMFAGHTFVAYTQLCVFVFVWFLVLLTSGLPSDQRKSSSMVLSFRPVHWYSL